MPVAEASTEGMQAAVDPRRARLLRIVAGTERTEEGSRTDLSGVRGRSVVGRSVRLDGAILEGADFTDADLSGASFRQITAGEICFADALLEDAIFQRASLRFARFTGAFLDGSDFAGADLWGADMTGADADRTVFRDAHLDEALLRDANLTFADFGGASLRKASLAGSRLKGATFTGAKLDGADLTGADLSDTTLVRLNLTACKLTHLRLAGAWLDGTRMSVEQLGGAVGEEIARDYGAAQLSYLALERNLVSIGSKGEASWAYKQSRRMGRFATGEAARRAWTARQPADFVRHGYSWTADRFVEWLCDYGESLSRIVRAFSILIVVFAVLFGLAGGMIPVGAEGDAPTRNALDMMSYSALNMLTSNPPDIGIKPVGRFTNLLVGVQGAVGIVLLGLFGFVLGNRLRR